METIASHAALGGALLAALGFLTKYLIGGVTKSIDKLDGKMDAFTSQQAAISVKVAVLESSVDSVKGRVREVELWRANGSDR